MWEFFKTLRKYRAIIFYRTLASLRADTRALYLGYLWWILEPLLNTALYYFIFAVLLNHRTSDFIAYLLLGNVVFQWYQACVSGSMGTITARVSLYRQIPLPKYLFAMVGIVAGTWKFLCVFSIVVIYIVTSTQARLDWHLLWLPVVMAAQFLLISGLAIPLSIASVYIRDLQSFMAVVFRAQMYLSAIFWDVEKVPDGLRSLFFSNPVASLIHEYRTIILHHKMPNLGHICYVIILSLALIQVGMWWHRKIDGHILKRVQA